MRKVVSSVVVVLIVLGIYSCGGSKKEEKTFLDIVNITPKKLTYQVGDQKGTLSIGDIKKILVPAGDHKIIIMANDSIIEEYPFKADPTTGGKFLYNVQGAGAIALMSIDGLYEKSDSLDRTFPIKKVYSKEKLFKLDVEKHSYVYSSKSRIVEYPLRHYSSYLLCPVSNKSLNDEKSMRKQCMWYLDLVVKKLQKKRAKRKQAS